MTKTELPSTQQQLQQALQQHQQAQKRLNRITVIVSVVLAILVSGIAANTNLYSILATFVAALVFFILASIYERSLALLLPLIILFCLADNYLSYPAGFNHPHFLLQLIPLVVFTAVFKLSRPYLVRSLSAQSTEQP